MKGQDLTAVPGLDKDDPNGPVCIYCGSPGPFNKEHVFPYSLGAPENDPDWLLIDAVCADCNSKFSQLELEFARNTFPINLLRLTYGPRGRGDEPVTPMRGTYEKKDDPFKHEAFITEGINHYLPPKVFFISDNEITFLSAERVPLKRLLKKLYSLSMRSFILTLKDERGQRIYHLVEWPERVTRLTDVEAKKALKELNKVFLVIRQDLDDGVERPGIYLNPQDQVVIIAREFEEAVYWLSTQLRKIAANYRDIISSVNSAVSTPDTDGRVHIRGKSDLKIIAKFLAKTGVNFVCREMGPRFARSQVFNNIRSFVNGDIDYSLKDPDWPLVLSPHGESPINFLGEDGSHVAVLHTNKHGYFFLLDLFNRVTYTVRLSSHILDHAPVNKLHRVIFNERSIVHIGPREMISALMRRKR